MTENAALSKQGKRILACFEKHADTHLTAEDIGAFLKTDGESVSLATIYRQLEKLTASGIIRKYTTSPDAAACYQYSNRGVSHCAEHFHLKCTVCGKLFHVTCPYLDKLEEHIGSHHGFRVDNTRTVLYGICKTCGGK